MLRRTLLPGLGLASLTAALVFCGPGQAKATCTSTLLEDWRDGRIGGTYSVGCYRTALEQLPEDLRVYSSAESDIRRALVARVEAEPAAAKEASSTGSGGDHRVSVVLVLAILGAVLAVTGSALAFTR
jgi:hypothetical protein